jgi:hypothetical protein
MADVSPAPSPEPPRSPRSKQLLFGAGAAVLAVIVAVGLLISRGGASPAKTTTVPAAGATGAANGGRQGARPGTSGVIASKSGSSMTVTTANGQTVQVATTGSTVVTRTVSTTLSGIHVGDHVVARGTTTGSAMAATGVTDFGANAPTANASGGNGFGGGGGGGRAAGSNGSAANRQANPGAQGTVTAVSPSGLTINDATGATITVTTNGSTTFSATTTSTFASLVVGEQVQVTGSTGSDGAVTATAIRVGGGGFGGNGGPNNNAAGA